MIPANELRIGNWVYAFKTTWRIQGDDFRFDEMPYDPIPLTPEILIKAGFSDVVSRTTQPDCTVWESHRFEFIRDKTRLVISLGQYKQFDFQKSEYNLVWFKDEEDPFKHTTNLFKHIFYLHQLQNLYFALTGEELIIKMA